MKSNREQSPEEFAYTFACKKMMNDLILIEDHLRQAKSIGINGLSSGALRNVEGRVYDLKAAVLNALKTVGI